MNSNEFVEQLKAMTEKERNEVLAPIHEYEAQLEREETKRLDALALEKFTEAFGDKALKVEIDWENAEGPAWCSPVTVHMNMDCSTENYKQAMGIGFDVRRQYPELLWHRCDFNWLNEDDSDD